MNEDMKYRIMVCMVWTILAWIIAMASCVSHRKYVTPSGVVVELPHAPVDSLKKGGAK